MKEYINDIIPFHNIIIRNGYVHSSIFVWFLSPHFSTRESCMIYLWKCPEINCTLTIIAFS